VRKTSRRLDRLAEPRLTVLFPEYLAAVRADIKRVASKTTPRVDRFADSVNGLVAVRLVVPVPCWHGNCCKESVLLPVTVALESQAPIYD